MYFIDSNIFLRFFTKGDKAKIECGDFLKLIEEGKIKAVTGSVVLAEVVWTLASYYKFSKDEISPAINAILNLRGLKITDNYDPIEAIDIFSKYKIKFIDCLIASIPEIRTGNTIVVSYDSDFDKLEVLRKEPRDFI